MMRRATWGQLLVMLFISGSLSLGFELMQAKPAAAVCDPSTGVTPYNTYRWCGYFAQNVVTSGDEVIDGGFPAWVVDANSFISFINSTKAGLGPDANGARFIILTMMGYNSPQVPGQADVVGPEWENRVRAMGAAGQISFFYNHPFPCGILNSYNQDITWDDAFYFEPASAGRCGPGVTRPSIIFCDINCSTPGRTIIYSLKRDCANPWGVVNALPVATYQLETSLAPGTSTPPFGGIVQPGPSYHLTPFVWNPSAVQANAFVMEVGTVTGRGANYTQNAGGPYQVAGCLNGAPACWRWSYPGGLPPGWTFAETDGAAFRVAVGAPEGQEICFTVTVSPSNNTTGAPSSEGPFCFVAYQPHYPAVIGQSGDVHAGGGLCGQAALPGSITTHASSNALSEYVVSSTGLVTNFGSNNAAGGTTATLGRTGNYYTVCRPDLVSVARAYINGGGAYTPLGGGSHNLATLPVSPSGVYLHNGGGDIQLHGVYSRKITIVSLTGTVTIDGPITLAAPLATGNNAPSLGLISLGDINITGGLAGLNKQVDAYLFSDGTINTCIEGNVPACRNTLVVNGFLMARGLSFRRLGPASGPTATVGERINLTGQLYLNPPKFFDNATTTNLLRNQGEKPPLN